MRPEKSPYQDLRSNLWEQKTRDLISVHPLNPNEAVEAVLTVWNDIFASRIGNKAFRIGRDLFPKPQILAFFLHELVPLELATQYPGIWRGDESAGEKDLEYVPDPSFSVEIKTSSHPSQIFGNRSYAQKPKAAKKTKSGYYLAINFESCGRSRPRPNITRIRFGWLDHEDWAGQRAQTGQ